MTEKQLRESLKDYLAPADLPDRRKQALLAAIREEATPAPAKGEPTMFRPNKFRTAMIAAIIVTLLSFTVALAAGFSGYVNFKGEPVANYPMAQPTPMPTEGPAPTELSDEAFIEILNREMNAVEGYLIDVSLEYKNGGGKGGSKEISLTAHSLEELVALLDSRMPLPNIPEGFYFHHGYVTMGCDDDSAYELVHEETTPEGVVIRHYAIPDGAEVPLMYSLILKNDAGDLIYCTVNLGFAISGHHFGVGEEDVVKTPTVPGMDDAILIIKPDSTRLTMRYTLEEPILLWSSHVFAWERWPIDTYDTMEFSVDSDTVPADILLSMYK